MGEGWELRCVWGGNGDMVSRGVQFGEGTEEMGVKRGVDVWHCKTAAGEPVPSFDFLCSGYMEIMKDEKENGNEEWKTFWVSHWHYIYCSKED